MAKANRIAAEWDKRTRELRKKLLRKQQARDRGEETGSDDDDDNDDDEVAVDMDWDVLEDEDTLANAHRPMQGPFPFHAEGSESSGPVGARESAAPSGVPPEDQWMGEGGSAAAPEVLMEGGGSAAMPHELTGGGGCAAKPGASTERGGSIAAPSEIREASPPAREQGAGSKRTHPDESGQGSRGSSPKRSRHPKAPE